MKFSEKSWNYIAPVYRFLRKNPLSHFSFLKEFEASRSLLQQFDLKQINCICDLGTGRGHSLDLVPGNFKLKIAIDQSMSMIRHTHNIYADTCFISADVIELPIRESSFDLILCIGLVEYVAELNGILTEIWRILKNEKYVLITYSPKNILTHIRIINGHRIYARRSIEVEKQIKKHNFEILDKRFVTTQHQLLLKKSKG